MVIDTCIFIEHLRSKDRNNTTLAKLPTGKPIYLSVVTLFELHSGADSPDKKRDITEITDDLDLLPFDKEVAIKAGDIYRSLKRKNKLIGVSDIMIAATCLVFGQPILTSNKKHFTLVDKLEVL